uniref:Uncharacterized protein n=1 Tax=Quercus lobata TaxID=97700 RepID=A0A7N2RB60_QUELO
MTPLGYIGLYVGEERKRYEVLVKYLSLPAFEELIVQSQADELEAKIEGPIMLACKTEEFDQLLKLAKNAFSNAYYIGCPDNRCSSSAFVLSWYLMKSYSQDSIVEMQRGNDKKQNKILFQEYNLETTRVPQIHKEKGVQNPLEK